MDDDPAELQLIGDSKTCGIGTDCVEADKKVAADNCTLAVVERDDVSILIVLQELAVHTQDFLVIDKDIGDISHTTTVVASNHLHPCPNGCSIYVGHRHVYGLKRDHLTHNLQSSQERKRFSTCT